MQQWTGRGTQSRPGKLVRPPWKKKAPRNMQARAMRYAMRSWTTSATAVGKTRPTAPEQVLHAHRRTQKKRRRTRRRESGSTESVDPPAAHLGMRKRLVREKGQTARGGRRGSPRGAGEEDPRGGGTRLFDPEVEVEC